MGTQSLQIQTRDTANFGVTNHLSSAKIDPAGEDGSTIHTVGVQADPASHFFASFWYHTPAEPFVSVDQNGDPRSAPGLFAQLNPASKRASFDSPADRYAQIRLSNSTNTLDGLVRVAIGWPTPTAPGFVIEEVADLQWGQWYRFEVGIHFVAGLGPGDEPNDLFSVRVFAASGALVGVACGSTWEWGYRTQNYLGGNTLPLAVNSFDFASNTGPNDRVVGHLDDFTMTSSNASVAAPAVTIGGELSVPPGGTTLLTANATGGDGGIDAYAWRDENDVLVGTEATLEAGVGTYTVTVTDAFCGSATSEPVIVTAAAITAIPTASTWALIALGIALAGAAVLRLAG